ncbi:response regulator [Rhizobiaceae bacterium n13]|uniref:Response regulator n=1 Tax=Ferirhizobium litorale TaxID=2927786 RepID=A0AAE3U3L5_9HYPH|nr:response regulator [Fererhizobium litorale]MDI7861594.1 response regulator [Fererhizobium litorale]MDI7922064.1 response regulator [Fererhizobium litorale]
MAPTNIKKIAIVDDDRYVRESIKDLLEFEGFASELYSSAEDFLSREGHLSVDCILADVRMTGMSGIDMLQILKQRENCPPILIMTSYANAQLESSALRSGAAAFLGKPLDSEQLLTCLQSAVGGGSAEKPAN